MRVSTPIETSSSPWVDYVFFGVHPFGALQNKVYDAKDVTEIKVAKNIIEMEGERLDIVSDKPVSISKPTTRAP